MNKTRRKRFLIVFVVAVIAVILMVYSILPNSIVNRGTAPLSFIFKPVENLISTIRVSAENYFETNKKNQDLIRQNDSLVEENIALRLKIKENEVAAAELEKLKEVYNLSNRYDYASLIAARITQRPLNEQMGLYRIDQGSNAGIDLAEVEGYPVVNAEAKVFGRIYNADAFSAKVLPITHEGFSVSCYLEQNRGQAFLLRGDPIYKKQNLCVLDEIPTTAVINVGDSIITSGQGGIFPYGLELGTVKEILPVNQEGFRQALVEVSIDFKDTDVVFIMSGREFHRPETIETE